ncbi:MAG TPA: SH3 domain-containing protein [Alphaproteobacteria bacterium]|nr:SH3 domain-containing protein [Alphaproteobacteria bacterium]
MKIIADMIRFPLFSLILALFVVVATPFAVVAADDNGGVSGLPLPRFASLKSDNVYMRTGPSMDYPIRWIYKREGLPVEIIQEFDSWRRIKDPEGETGWVHKILLSGKKTAQIKSEEEVLAYDDDDLVRPVAKIENGYLVGLEKCDKRACFATFPPYEGWIEKKYLWGVYASDIFN